jgi:hypothetical protein
MQGVVFGRMAGVARSDPARARAAPGALFVAGGEHITALTEFSLRDCPALTNGQFVQVSGFQRLRDINHIPWPIWPEGYLEQFWQAGKSYGVQTARDMPIMASRGCP